MPAVAARAAGGRVAPQTDCALYPLLLRDPRRWRSKDGFFCDAAGRGGHAQSGTARRQGSSFGPRPSRVRRPGCSALSESPPSSARAGDLKRACEPLLGAVRHAHRAGSAAPNPTSKCLNMCPNNLDFQWAQLSLPQQELSVLKVFSYPPHHGILRRTYGAARLGPARPGPDRTGPDRTRLAQA